MEFLEVISYIEAVAGAIIFGAGYVFILYLLIKELFSENATYMPFTENVLARIVVIFLFISVLIGIPANVLYIALHP